NKKRRSSRRKRRRRRRLRAFNSLNNLAATLFLLLSRSLIGFPWVMGSSRHWESPRPSMEGGYLHFQRFSLAFHGRW
ncbi:hypothetical protein SK128_027850, partial [Halocaridina rubra]